MKLKVLLLVMIMLILTIAAPAQSGGVFTVTQSVIASGGGQNSSGGSFTVQGTIGQPVAGQPAFKAPYTGYAGFWTPRSLPTTAAGAVVSGRAATADGRGIRSVIITLTSQTGEKRTTISSVFGNFRFADVPAGSTYVLTAEAKHYQFTQPTQIYFVTGNLSEIVFTATH